MPAALGNMSKFYCACLHEFWKNILPTNFTNHWTIKGENECLEFSCKRAQSRTCSGYAERSRKSRRRGTTERSDGNRVRSARIGEVRTMCLEGTTPQDMLLIHRHRRTAFQAEPFQQPLPRTSSPVIVAALRTAFQAVNTLII